MDSWVLEDFSIGDIACQIAEFEVRKDLGEEGLGYEITTPSYQS